MRVAYIGFTVTELPGWQNFVPGIRAPANYKDQGKIAEYIASAQDKQRLEAAWSPLTGRLNTVAMLSGDKPAFSDIQWPAVSPLEFLLNYDAIVGLRIFEFLDLAVVDAVTKKMFSPLMHWAKLGSMIKFPYLLPRSSNAHKIIFDPVATVLGAYEPQDINKIAERLDVPKWPDNLAAGEAAMTGAIFARNVAQKMGY